MSDEQQLLEALKGHRNKNKAQLVREIMPLIRKPDEAYNQALNDVLTLCLTPFPGKKEPTVDALKIRDNIVLNMFLPRRGEQG